MFSSLWARLVSALSLCMLLLMGGALLIDYRLTREQIISDLAEEADSEVSAVLRSLDGWLGKVEDTTGVLGTALLGGSFNQAQIEAVLRDVVANDGNIYGATIAVNPLLSDNSAGFAPYFYRDGDRSQPGAVNYVDLNSGDYSYTTHSWYQAAVAAGRGTWSEPYFDRGGGEVAMTTYSLPVYELDAAQQRQLYAVVTADVALADLHHELQLRTASGRSFVLLFSGDNRLLSAPDEKLRMQEFLPLLEDDASRLVWRSLLDSGQRRENSQRWLPCPQVFDECIVRMSFVPATGWPLAMVFAEDAVLAPLRDYQLKLAAISTLTLLLAVAVIAWVTRRATAPLRQLTRVTEQTARGELDAELPDINTDDEIGRLVASYRKMQSDLQGYVSDLATESARRSRLQTELEAARDIQLGMMPDRGAARRQVGDAMIWARVQPARRVGGDLFLFQRLDDNKLLLAVGDVSDKGIAAALFMARAISMLQQLTDEFRQPAAAMAQLNELLVPGNDNCMFLTLVAGVLDMDSGEFLYASAGHCPAWVESGGAAREVPQSAGPALGLATGQGFVDNRLLLAPGERLALLSDGIEEAFNQHDEMYGNPRFQALLGALSTLDADSTGESVLADLGDFAHGREQADDITLLLLDWRRPAGARRQRFLVGSGLVSRVQGWLAPELEALAVPRADQRDWLLLAEEVVSNIDKYAQLEQGDAIEITLRQTAEGVTLLVVDPGQAFNPLLDAQRATLGESTQSADIGGLGVHLICALTDQQHYQRHGNNNHLLLRKNFTTGSQTGP